MPFKIPFLNKDEGDEIGEKKEQTLFDLEEEQFRNKIIHEHEQFRNDVWLPLKLFRGHYDNERFQSETILDDKGLIQKKKDQDKILINAIRTCILSDQEDKLFTYIDMLNFAQSYNLCVKLCVSLNKDDLAQRVRKLVAEKEQNEIIHKQYSKKKQSVEKFDSHQVTACMQMK